MSKFLNSVVFLFLKIVCTLANSVYLSEMLLCTAFYLGLHCLLVSGVKRVKRVIYRTGYN